jgi:hypothetical protein
MRRLLLLAVALLAAGCQAGSASGGGEDVERVWDLRTSHTVADVGWPEGHEASEYIVEPGGEPVRVLLPGGLEVTEAQRLFARLAPGDRPDPEDPGATPLESVGLAFPNEDPDAALQRARELAAVWGVDVSALEEAHARRDGQLTTRIVAVTSGAGARRSRARRAP